MNLDSVADYALLFAAQVTPAVLLWLWLRALGRSGNARFPRAIALPPLGLAISIGAVVLAWRQYEASLRAAAKVGYPALAKAVAEGGSDVMTTITVGAAITWVIYLVALVVCLLERRRAPRAA